MSVYISKVYTKTGDGGKTALVGGKLVPKSSLRIDSYGEVDELNAVVGIVRRMNKDDRGDDGIRAHIDALLERIQSELFNLGSLLATLPADLAPTQPRILPKHVTALEAEIDLLNDHLPPLRSFTLPGGGTTSSFLHLARTVCRRAERAVVRLSEIEEVDPQAIIYLNRLSDLFYVLGRWNVRQREEEEILWKPEAP